MYVIHVSKMKMFGCFHTFFVFFLGGGREIHHVDLQASHWLTILILMWPKEQVRLYHYDI
jgi:hypothetical protein